MVSPEEFIQLGLEEIKRRIESKDPFLDVSHVVRRKKAHQVEEIYIMKKSLVYVEVPRIAGQKTTERNLFITYRELGLWIVVEEIGSELRKVISIRRYKYLASGNSWEEIENDTSGINKREE